MPRLSIIIPFRGAAEPFEATLASVLQNRPAHCEVLVTHAGPYDDPYELANEVRFIEQPGDASWVDLLNAGLAESTADILHVLGCGVEVDEGWTDAAIARFADSDVAAVSPLILDSSDKCRIVAKGVKYGSGGRRLICGAKQILRDRALRKVRVAGPTLAAGFYRAAALDAIGAFEPDVGDDLADIDAALSLHAIGLRCVFEPECRVYSSLLTTPAGSFSAGRHAERLFLRHVLERGRLWSWLCHPWVVVANAIGDLPHPGAVTQLLGRAIGCLEIRRIRAYRQQIAEAQARLAESPTTEPADVLRIDSAVARRESAKLPAPTLRRRAA